MIIESMLQETGAVRDRLLKLYGILKSHFGHQRWWPADGRFEIIIGSLLTQNTNWLNVTKALDGLKTAGLMNPRGIAAADQRALAELIRPSGYYNQKAIRLQTVSHWFIERCGCNFAAVTDVPTPALRRELLALTGIGPETADSILLYAFDRPVFVIDAYTRRILSRMGIFTHKASYDDIQHFVQSNLNPDLDLYNDFHAQFVALGKEICRPKPNCNPCQIRKTCSHAVEVLK